jgi:hypothetical protein
MPYEDNQNNSGGIKELRKFGITFSILFGLFWALFFWRGKDYYFCFLILSGFFLFLGLVLPGLLKPVHKIWMMFARLLGWYMTMIILSILFYLIVTPISLLGRVLGKDFLETKIDRDVVTYWIPRKAIQYEKQSYENQF